MLRVSSPRCQRIIGTWFRVQDWSLMVCFISGNEQLRFDLSLETVIVSNHDCWWK
ncbi:hypothetical protein RchiOBHm_Chr2g0160961 [Rosa chinensis]|uniref:Uncharacterized protein n=1 Tax=Rosa chinensis TaxID=74649 RepID=A0A2P6S2N7_ROSCH|nr:hypothetical protein RchiOBHm_Chr2g0160961 [Rosa chinensis]